MKLVLGKRLAAAGVLRLCALALLTVWVLTGWGPTVQAQTAPQSDKTVTLHGNVHPMSRVAGNDRGILQDQQPVTRMQVLLRRSAEQEAALQQLMADQLDAKSPRFHAWLTPQQFGEQFGPADSDAQAVKNWLSAQGFTGLRVNNGKTLIEFSGTAGQVRNAFRTEMHRLSVRGEEHFANMQEPQIPAALAPVIAGVAGLHNFHPKSLSRRFGKFQRNGATGEITPLFTYTDGNGTFYGVGPADFAKIYNVPAGFNGSGTSIAIVGQSNINMQDVTDFRSIFGLPAYSANCSSSPCLSVILNGPDPGLVSGDEGESDLDVEWSGAVAPMANINFVTTQSTSTDGVSGVDASAVYIVDNNVAQIMSESYGSCESSLTSAGNAFYNSLWQQAAAEGITVVVSAGDNGSAGCDDTNSETAARSGIAVSGLASTPYNVAMGGTDFNQANNQATYWNTADTSTTPPVPASAKGYIPEMPWNDSCARVATAANLTVCASATTTSTTSPLNIVAGSGGPSSVYTTKPAFQMGFGDSARDLPDVSLFSADGGNKSFYIVCESDQDIPGDTGCNLTTQVQTANCSPCHDFQAVGGTSAAAPSFAGIMALVVQKTGQRQGNANVELYNLAKSETFANCDSAKGPAAGCVFNDVTVSIPTGGSASTTNLNNSVPCPGGASTPNCSKTTSGGFGVLAVSGTPAFTSTVGYDLATGLGTPNVTNLVNGWTTAAATGSAATVTLIPATVTGVAGSVSANLTGTVTGGSGTATGVIILENAATNAPLTSATLSGGSYSIPAGLLPAAAATYTVKAHYSGDATYAPKDSANITVNLTKQTSSTVAVSFVTFTNSNPPQPVLSTSPSSVQYGSAYILRVDVQGSKLCADANGNVILVCPTGTVTLKDNGSALNDFPNAQNNNATSVARLNDRGFAEDQPIQLGVGPHAITAAYTADASSSYSSQASSNSLSVTITQATTTTAVVPSATIVMSGGSITLTATVSSSSNSSLGPTGTVQFLNGGANFGAAVTCTPTPANASGSTLVGALCTATLPATALSALPPGFYPPQPRGTPLVIVGWLAAAMAAISFLAAMLLAARRRQFACAGFVLALVAAGVITGCGGGSSGSGGGTTRSLSAKYSGDTNYAGSTSSAVTVRIQ